MMRRGLAIAVAVAVMSVVTQPTAASATVSRYIDTPRNEFGIALDTGYHAWAVDSAAHPYANTIWVKPDGGRAYRVSSRKSGAYVGNIDVANPTYGDVLVFYSGAQYGRGQYNLKLWDLANREALTLPAGINTPTADESQPSIGGGYLAFQRTRPSGATRLLLYRFSTATFTTVATGSETGGSFSDQIHGNYLVYHRCLGSGVCNVFRRQISTGATVEAPNPGHANYYPTVTSGGTVYYVQGSARSCGLHTKLLRWTGSGSPTLLVALPRNVEAGPMDAYDAGASTTLYFTRIRCNGFHYGIYQLPNA
jgi:hypothetical protein